MKYNSNNHLHVDSYAYNEKNYKEAIAYKHETADKWDFYFDFAAYGLEPLDKQARYMFGAGYHIFTVDAGTEFEYMEGSDCFCRWLLENEILY